MVELMSFPAKNGDAFLLRGTSCKRAMLIDGGYSSTFRDFIKQELQSLAADGYVLDFVVATHIDSDHISGLISFFEENGQAQAPSIIKVGKVIHNSLRALSLQPVAKTKISSGDLELLGELRRLGHKNLTPADVVEKDISAQQGASLAHLLLRGGYPWNDGRGCEAVGEDGLVEFDLPGIRIQILGPARARLDGLKKWWVSEVRKVGFAGALAELDDIFEFVCANEAPDVQEELLSSSEADLAEAHVPDTSVTNGSSISFIVEIEGKRILFLGDSWAQDIADCLKKERSTTFNAVKVAHHGSLKNTSVELLDILDSPHFFISTDGSRHSHPDFAVLKAIADRPADFCRTLHFNYPTPASRKLKAVQKHLLAPFKIDEMQNSWVEISELQND